MKAIPHQLMSSESVDPFKAGEIRINPPIKPAAEEKQNLEVDSEE